ncbi:MAG: rhomboid family intramembrane serine protease [Erysipelotrichaceae bacterium]|nr:rhomboid family intramembrane serine protease [Erysipelotrichaceae bacterium]
MVILIIAANLIVYFLIIYDKLDFKVLAQSYDTVYRKKQFYRIITAAFTHLQPMHILFNLFALYHVGRFVEAYFGTGGFLLVLFGSIILGHPLALYIHHDNGQDSLYSVGASGGICGLIGAELVAIVTVYGFRAGIMNISMTLIYMVLLSIMPKVDGAAHISCFAIGLAIAYILTLL